MPSSASAIFGPLLIGAFLNAVLHGVFLGQTYRYFETFKTDSKWPRYLVLYLVMIETANTLMDIAVVFQPLILEFGSPAATIISPIFLAAEPIVTAAISMPVQVYFAWRIRSMTKSNFWPAVVVLFSLVSFAAALSSTILVTIFPAFALLQTYQSAIAIWLGSAAVTDVIITVLLVSFLRKSKSGFKDSDTIVDKIILMAVQTGLVTSLSSIVVLVVYVSVPGTTIMFIWDFSLAKFYAISLLASLNARAEWNRHKLQAKNPISFIDVEKLNLPLWSASGRFQRPAEYPTSIHLAPPPMTFLRPEG
ncbi:hypothetical protein C8J56DRAFT_937554 [Mycena floridula]|nr:hypothetical protein C8J56DRAFT_937554 [Mycena floridula]